MFEVIVVLLSLVVIHYKFRDKMTDLLQSLQGVYKKYEDIAKPHIEYHKNLVPTGTMTNGGLRNRKLSNGPNWIGSRHSRERKRSAPISPKVSFSAGHFKMAPAPCLNFQGSRPFMGSCCSKCVPMSRNSALVDEVSQAFGLKNLLKVDNWKKCDGFVSRRFPVFSHAWNTKITFKYPDVSRSVVAHTRVKEAVEMSASRELNELGGEDVRYGMLLRHHERRAVEALRIMSAKVSHFLLRFAAWSLFKLLGRILTSIQVNKGQMEMLKKAHKASIPVIYLPLHRSHLDYILVSFILVNYEIKAPLVAAGDNLRIWFFGSLLRGLGAFFIKRKLDPKAGEKDFVYRSVLHSYMEQVLKTENSLEFFIEGGRSRNGKACLPKAGLLSVVVEAIFDGVIDDAFIVPVGISYEKIIDGNFISEQMGKPKRMESFTNAVKSIWKVMHSNFGNVRVNFAQPYSLKEIIQAVQLCTPVKARSPLAETFLSPIGSCRRSSISSLNGQDIVMEEEHRLLVKGLANHIVHDAINVTTVMSTNILAFLLLNKFRKGVTLNSLVVAFEEMKEELTLMRRRDVGFSGDTIHVIEHATKLLGPDLVHVETIKMDTAMDGTNYQIVFLRPNLSVPSVLEISYYSNVVLSVFLSDSIVATALRTFIDKRNQVVKMQEILISRSQLLEKSLDLCDILQYEFIISPPCSTVESTLTEAIQELITSHIITRNDEGGGMTNGQKLWANKMAFRLGCDGNSSEEDDYYSSVEENLTVHLTPESVERFDFYCSMMAPFIEGYWQLASCLHHLVHKQMTERSFINMTLSIVKDKVNAGTVSYPECVSAEILRNGLKLFEKWRIVDSHQQDSVKVVYLNSNFDSEKKLLPVLQVLAEFKL